jgi:GDP/UDP-N,N'-diacetylbacillosamine 2-epimerase (hydrolysing)
MTRRICVVTGTRAEYGLLRWVIDQLKWSGEVSLQIIATGMHLSPEFGLTVRSIEDDGYEVDRKVEMLLSSDTSVGLAKSVGVGVMGFADAIHDLKPDLLLLLGDRFEILSAAIAAMMARVPIAHIHGGEATEGLIDESIRHSLTKMSHLHFVATEQYRRRVIQLGEQPSSVFNVGGLGVDAIRRVTRLGRSELEKSLGIRLLERNVLVTFHPVTLESHSAEAQMTELLAVLGQMNDTGIVFTMPNADTDGRVLIRQINEFCLSHSNAWAFVSLGQQRYFSCVDLVDIVIGNSSSGLTEVPSFRKPTINIGDRQKGRVKCSSVIDCSPDRVSISRAIQYARSLEFEAVLKSTVNPYGDGGASEAIVDILVRYSLEGLLKKRFYDL